MHTCGLALSQLEQGGSPWPAMKLSHSSAAHQQHNSARCACSCSCEHFWRGHDAAESLDTSKVDLLAGVTRELEL